MRSIAKFLSSLGWPPQVRCISFHGIFECYSGFELKTDPQQLQQSISLSSISERRGPLTNKTGYNLQLMFKPVETCERSELLAIINTNVLSLVILTMICPLDSLQFSQRFSFSPSVVAPQRANQNHVGPGVISFRTCAMHHGGQFCTEFFSFQIVSRKKVGWWSWLRWVLLALLMLGLCAPHDPWYTSWPVHGHLPCDVLQEKEEDAGSV